MPKPSKDKSILIVYREYAQPTAYAATIYADGKRNLNLEWPRISGSPGWEGKKTIEPNKVYYYKLISGFGTRLQSQSDEIATVTLKSCCKLITEMKDQAIISNQIQAVSTTISPRKITEEKRDNFFKDLEKDMLPDDIIMLIGKPDSTSAKATHKSVNPFYFGSDTRRTYWLYNGIGYVIFSRNEYTGSLKLIETKYDKTAK